VGERLLLVWLRFRWLIVAAMVVTPMVAAGAVWYSLSDGDTVAPPSSRTYPGYHENLSVVEEPTLVGCRSEDAERTRQCVAELFPAGAVVLREDGNAFLDGLAWRNLDGGSEPLPMLAGEASPGTQARPVLGVDLDNDGERELIFATTGPDGAPGLLALSRDRAGNHYDTATVRGLQAHRGVVEVVPADINEDGWVDLVAVHAPGDPGGRGPQGEVTLTVYMNRGWAGPGTFYSLYANAQEAPVVAWAGNEFVVSDAGAAGVLVTDLDGDGHQDVAVYTRPAQGWEASPAAIFREKSLLGLYFVFWGDGTEDALLRDPEVGQLPVGVRALEAGDVDGDGALDLLAAYDYRSIDTRGLGACAATMSGRLCAPYPGTGTIGGVAVLSQQTVRTFTPNVALALRGISEVSALAVVDLDGDGRAEIVVGREPTQGQDDTDLLLAYERVDEDDLPVAYEAVPLSGLGGLAPIGRFVPVDLRGDGTVDLAVTGRGQESLSIWWGASRPDRYLRVQVRGAGTLHRPGSGTPPLGAVVTVRDIDGRVHRVTLDRSRHMDGIHLALPLRGAGFSASSPVPLVEVFFPATGTRTRLTTIPVNGTVEVRER